MKKAYIVVNKEQEQDVLHTLAGRGIRWDGGDSPANFLPSKTSSFDNYPIAIYLHDDTKRLTWDDDGGMKSLSEDEIVYDGRKQVASDNNSKMTVPTDVYQALVHWYKDYFLDYTVVTISDLENLPEVVKEWRGEDAGTMNKKFATIINWVDGEDVFEVEKPKKWVVRSKGTDDDNDHWYVYLPNNIDEINNVVYYMSSATLFDTKEEAESWANAHQEVIEVEG